MVIRKQLITDTIFLSQVKSFSQLRNDFYETDRFYLSTEEHDTVRGAKVTREDPRKMAAEDRKNGKILRRHNSEPLLQGKTGGEVRRYLSRNLRCAFGLES